MRDSDVDDEVVIESNWTQISDESVILLGSVRRRLISFQFRENEPEENFATRNLRLWVRLLSILQTRLLIAALSLEKPAPVQQRAIAPLLRGRDLIMQAQSGTGKTAAFVIAILQKVRLTPSVAPQYRN